MIDKSINCRFELSVWVYPALWDSTISNCLLLFSFNKNFYIFTSNIKCAHSVIPGFSNNRLKKKEENITRQPGVCACGKELNRLPLVQPIISNMPSTKLYVRQWQHFPSDDRVVRREAIVGPSISSQSLYRLPHRST